MPVRKSEMPPADPTVLTLEDLRDLYCTRTIHEAAKDLDVGLTALKRRCRVLGIRRWPYRTLSSLEKLLDDVRNIREELTEEDKKKQQQTIEKLQVIYETVRLKPNEPLSKDDDDDFKRMRQSMFKSVHKEKKRSSQSGVMAAQPRHRAYDHDQMTEDAFDM